MPFEGFLDHTSQTALAGWVYRSEDPDRAFDVDILGDRKVIATVTANQFRSDLQNAGKGSGFHAFHFQAPEGYASSEPLRARVTGQRWFLQLSTQAFPRPYAMMRHSCEYGIPEPAYGFSEMPPVDEAQEIALTRRLIEAHGRSAEDQSRGRKREDQWTLLEGSIFRDVLEILSRKDAESLSMYLRDFFARSISHGTYQGPQATAGLETPGAGLYPAAQYVDFLASLAEAIGALPVESPELTGHYGENLFQTPDELTDGINRVLGIDIVPPNVAGRKWGLLTRNGILAASDIRAVYAAYRIRELIGTSPGLPVCEIGGGIGSAAYYCHLVGIRNYTIIDLPLIGLVQGYWLTRALPGARVILYGEPDDRTEAAIRLAPPSQFGASRYELVYNQDSFPEMHTDHSTAYLKRLREVAPALLSINQESEGVQTASSRMPTVARLVDRVGGFRRVYRFPHWLRVGYVEELYAVEGEAGGRWQQVLRLFGKK